MSLVLNGLEILWNSKTIALWINNRDDVKRYLGMGKTGTASASFIRASNGEEILILNVVSMASWLHVLYHKSIFLA